MEVSITVRNTFLYSKSLSNFDKELISEEKKEKCNGSFAPCCNIFVNNAKHMQMYYSIQYL